MCGDDLKGMRQCGCHGMSELLGNSVPYRSSAANLIVFPNGRFRNGCGKTLIVTTAVRDRMARVGNSPNLSVPKGSKETGNQWLRALLP